MNKKQISITLGIMCFILTMSIIVQIKTMNNASATVGQTLTENGLRDEVLKWKEKYDSVYSQLGQAENRLEKVRNIATQDSSTSSAKQEELKNNNILLGLTDVTGPGMEIILKDNTNISSELLSTQILDMSKLVVHNTDLTAIVNMLRHANAEAISINDVRIINTTDIVEVGNTLIMVGGQRLSSPYVVKAIGNQAYLSSILSLKNSGFIDKYNNSGKTVTLVANKKVEILKYNGETEIKYIKK